MRHTFCPRCDNLLNKNGHCSICGYQVKVRCHQCGHLNIPTAKYCGGCGKGTTFTVRYRNIVNNLLNPFQQIKIKRFFAGIAFGSLLALFAFGSMGMKYNPSDNTVFTEEIPIANSNESNEKIVDSPIVQSLSNELAILTDGKNKTDSASVDDMKKVVDIMIKNLNHIAQRVNKKKYPLDSVEDYLEQERCIKNNLVATRGNTALIFFAYMSDLFELKYKDYTQGSTYSDIPRFNIMDAPSTALKKYNIKLAASNEKFGVNDEISIGEICDAAKQVAILTVKRADIEAPDLVAPPSITIE